VTAFLPARVVRLGAALVLVAVVAAFAATGRAATGANYVALGDSYSSGVGTGSYTLDSACKRSVYAYPYLWWRAHPGSSLTFVACSGATTSDLITKQLSSVTTSTTLVTMTIGGNDIGFANLIYQCTLSNCSAALDTTTANLESTLGSALDTVYKDVKADAAPGATIIVLGYPQLFSGKGCLGTLGISATEESKANALADKLDTVIANHAKDDGVTYKSAIGAFGGHAVCSSSPWVNGLELFNTGESYHPSRTGHSSGYLPLVTAVTG